MVDLNLLLWLSITLSYTVHDDKYKADLEFVYQTGSKTGDTAVPPPIVPPLSRSTMCVSDKWHTVGSTAETCEDIAFLNNVSTVALYTANPREIYDCSSIRPAALFSTPPTTPVRASRPPTASQPETSGASTRGCTLTAATWVARVTSSATCYAPRRRTACASTAGREAAGTRRRRTRATNGYTYNPVAAPANATVAMGTTGNFGKWHVVQEDNSCVSICLSENIDMVLLLQVNPSLGKEYKQCTPALVCGKAYCTGPNYGGNEKDEL